MYLQNEFSSRLIYSHNNNNGNWSALKKFKVNIIANPDHQKVQFNNCECKHSIKIVADENLIDYALRWRINGISNI
jgi:hypothetical protein